ncbi:MAG TPA: hypothetical protein VHQ86_06245, partial [Candidatus Saccharimonadia bacterium]|nr:hypothetical protein [Candidatus Saccharimonadia bacterium]
MLDQRTRSLTILARILAVTGALIAVTVFGMYGFKPSLLPDTSISLTAAILGALAAVYFVTIHQVLKARHFALSTMILSIVIAVNLLLIITSTGGLDSPFYSFWLLAIVITGIFGTVEIITIAGLTIVYYAFQLILQGLHAPYINDHLIQFGIT